MAFDHVDVDRLGPGLTPEDIDQRMTTIRFDVDGTRGRGTSRWFPR